MKIKSIRQVEIDSLDGGYFDVVIVSSGYESRSVELMTRIQVNSENKFCLSFKNFDKNLKRKANDKFFRDGGFRSLTLSGDNHTMILEWFKKILDKQTGPELKILVDYSCMTRVWYASILNLLRYYQHNNIAELKMYFSYSIAKFSPAPKNSHSNIHVGPITGFNSITAPNLPTALVIGLGYIPQRAYGLKEYLDAVPFLFYTDSTDNNQFAAEVKKNNEQLIKQVSDENIYTYSIKQIERTYYLLVDVCKDLKDRYRVILAPCGPKPFTLACLLASFILDELDVWRISAGEQEKPTDKVATGEFVVLAVHFQEQAIK